MASSQENTTTTTTTTTTQNDEKQEQKQEQQEQKQQQVLVRPPTHVKTHAGDSFLSIAHISRYYWNATPEKLKLYAAVHDDSFLMGEFQTWEECMEHLEKLGAVRPYFVKVRDENVLLSVSSIQRFYWDDSNELPNNYHFYAQTKKQKSLLDVFDSEDKCKLYLKELLNA